MLRRRATLPPMDLERILADVCDIIDAQGGIWPAVEAAIDERWADNDEALDQALAYTVGLLPVYRERGGPAMIRQMRDGRRRLTATPPTRGWAWRATG